MQKKSDDFLEFSMHQTAAMAKSEAGQQLLGLLKSQHGDKIQYVLDQAKSGNFAQVKETMEAMMTSEQVQKLIKKMQE